MTPQYRGVTRRTLFALTPAAMGAFALTSCGSDLPQPNAPVVPTVAEGASVSGLSDEALTRILTDVSAVLASGDSKRDANVLESRFTGPALEQRKALYTWWNDPKRKPKADMAIAPIKVGTPEIRIASGAPADPRDLMVAVQSPVETPNSANYILLALRQVNPRENYKVWAGINLMVPKPDSRAVIIWPGPKFPSASEKIALNATTLVRTPQAVIDHYVDVLNRGDESEFSKEFYADAFRPKSAVLRQQFEAAVIGAASGTAANQYLKSATVTFSADVKNYAGLMTEVGTAVILAQITCTITLENNDPTNRVKVLLPKLSALAGADDFAEKLVIENTLVGAFTVPPAGAKAEAALVRCIGLDADLGEGLGQSLVTGTENLTQGINDGPGDGWGATKVSVS